MSYYETEWKRDGDTERTRYVDLHDFVRAVMAHEDYVERGITNDLGKYAEATVEAYVKAWGIDPRGYGKSGSDDGDPKFLFFWGSARKTYINLFDPFGISLEGPGDVATQQFRHRHQGVVESIRLTKTLLISLMVDGIIAKVPEADKLVREDEVKPEWEGAVPNAMDYW